MKNQKTKTIREQLLEPIEYSPDQRAHLNRLADEILRVFDNISLEQVVTLGQKKSDCLSRAVMVQWGRQWIDKLVAKGAAEKIDGCYEEPTFRIVMTGPPREATELERAMVNH
jgi:hypothetical protein